MTDPPEPAGSNVPGRADHGAAQVDLTVMVRGLRAYAKLGVHVLFTVAAVVATLLTNGGTTIEWLQVISLAVVAAGVWIAANTVPGAKYAKAVVSAIGAVLAVLIPALEQGGEAFSGGTLVNMVIAVLGVLGVWAVPNTTTDGENVLKLAARVRAANPALANPGPLAT
jgi:hypothetical protein